MFIAANGLADRDSKRDLAPVAYVGYAPLILVAPTSFDANTLADVIRLAKAEPGKLNYASAGSGGAPAIFDMLGGRINFMMLNPLEAIPHVKGGRLHAIMVGGAQRMALLPDV